MPNQQRGERAEVLPREGLKRQRASIAYRDGGVKKILEYCSWKF
jgi:hypothetical protein